MIYKNIVLKRPKKTSIHKTTGYNYVYYTVESERVGNTKYYKEKRISIGTAIDEETFNPNDNYFILFPDDKNKPELPSDKYFADTISIGAVMAMQDIAEKTHLSECLMHSFDKENGRKNTDAILDFATYSLIKESDAAQLYPYFRRKHAVLSSSITDGDSCCSFFKETLREEKIRKFFADWIKIQKACGTVCISVNSADTAAGAETEEAGNTKDGNTGSSADLSFVFDRDSGVPLFYELCSGSINDISGYRHIIKKAKELNLNESVFILNNGYFSYEKAKEICSLCDGYIVIPKPDCPAVKKAIELAKPLMDDVDNYIYKEKMSGAKVKLSLFENEENQPENYFYVYCNDSDRGTVISEMQTMLYEEYTDLKSRIGTVIGDDEINNLKKRFILKFDEKNRLAEVALNQAEWKRKSGCSGYFVIAGNPDKTPAEIYDVCKKHDSIEKAFKRKTYTGINGTGLQNDLTLSAKTFINFIAAILRSYILQHTESLRLKDNKTYALPGCIEELEQIEAVRWRKDQYAVLYALTERQENILAALNVGEEIFHNLREYN